MTNQEAAAMKSKLSELGLAHESIKVFGAIRCNVHVVCVSRATAHKWASALATVFNGAKVNLVPTLWDAVENKGTCLLSTKRKGFLIAVAA